MKQTILKNKTKRGRLIAAVILAVSLVALGALVAKSFAPTDNNALIEQSWASQNDTATEDGFAYLHDKVADIPDRKFNNTIDF